MSDRFARKVLLVGWDAADWKIINPLLDRGSMPTLERIVNQGVMGNLATLHPILSPLLWNSIATGKRPHQHGILGFMEPDPHSAGVRPVSSTSRRVKAVWNILTQQGLHAHVIGWFAGHPAEPIKGVSVSPLYTHPPLAQGDPWPLPHAAVHPAALGDTLAALRVHPAELPPELLLSFVPKAAEVDQNHDRHLAGLARALAQSASIHNAATWVLEHEPWDFLAVYFNAIDNVSHHFMRFHPPRMGDVHPRQFELYKDVVNTTYWFHDLLLARLLELAGPEATVMIVSDHGFRSNHLRPRGGAEPGGPEDWHRDLGIVCMMGPHIRRDERIYGASLLDVTPTVLTLFGLPVGEDMAGKPLVQAFESPVEAARIPSWEDVPGECGMHPADQRVDAETTEAVLQQFVALGYVEPPSEDQVRTRADVIRASRYNLARSYLQARRPQDALPILEQLAADPGAGGGVATTLVACYLRLGRGQDARRVLDGLVASGEAGHWIDWFLGLIEYEQGNADAALVYLRRAEEAGTRRPGLHLRVGRLYLRKGQLQDARRAFDKALELDDENAGAQLGLAMVALRERRNEVAAEHALAAVGLRHFMPTAHYHLGVALARLGQLDRAVLAFETAVHMEPRLINAHRWLRLLNLKRGDAARAVRHELLGEQLQRARQRASA